MDTIQIIHMCVTGIVAVITVIVLIQQNKFSKNQWKFTLYDKRYAIYDSTMRYLAAIGRSADLDRQILLEFSRDTKDKELLFGDDIKDYIDELYNKGNDLCLYSALLKTEPIGEKRDDLVDNQMKSIDWFMTQFDIAKEKFGKYMKIDNM